MQSHLSQAYHDCSTRGLVISATFAIEALVGLGLENTPINLNPVEPIVLLAKTYFDQKEFNRCFNALKNTSKTDLKAQFLRLFARYHAGETIKENNLGTELFVNTSKETTKPTPVNPYLEEILYEIEQISPIITLEDPFLLYLWALVSKQFGGNLEQSIHALRKSFLLYPFNWSCALELKNCFTKLVSLEDELKLLRHEFTSKNLECQTMFKLFYCFVHEDLNAQKVINILKNELVPVFPHFIALKARMARILSADGFYNEAANLFEECLKLDPFRLEDLDAYSNLLYVQDEREKLAYLAQYVTQVDKFRVESCCVVANYYSLRGDHAFAVEYYKRAITLNRQYPSTWTLMGHEFIEMGNPHAAIETYRMAVDLVPFDFRPLFGLGQAYEVLAMHYFAQYYFQRALALRPADVRVWDALGNCYEELHRDEDALSAFQQAFAISEHNYYYAYRIARLYEVLGNDSESVRLMTLCANVSETSELQETQPEWPSRAILWLANRALGKRQWAQALAWAAKVQNGTREMLEEARSIEAEAKRCE